MKSGFQKRPGETMAGLVREDQNTAELKDALLYDFDIDDDELKVAHKQYLAQAMQFMANRLEERKSGQQPGGRLWTVSIDGYASRTGDARHNDMLSSMREQAVAAYFRYYLDLKPALENVVTIDTNYHGFADTTVQGENPLGRSVRVVVNRPGLPPPPKPPEPQAAPRNFYCSDSSNDITNVLDRFFTLEPVIQVSSVRDMVDKVLRRLSIVPGTKIENMVIAGHGSPGWQAVGAGTDDDSTGAKSLQVDPAKSDQLLGVAAVEMAKLRGKFTENGTLSLFGCEVAHGQEGLELLRVVSRTIDTFVQGGIDAQRPLVPGWEGNVYRCFR